DELRARDPAVRVLELEGTAVAVGVGRRIAPRHERPEGVLKVAAEQRQHAAGLAVEAAPEAEHLGLARGRVDEPQRGLDGLGPARDHLDAPEALRRDGGHELENLRAGLGGEAAEGDPLDLALGRLDVMRMTVADAAHRDAGNEVDVLVAVLVDQGAVDAARHRQARVEREALRAGGEVLALLRDDLLRARSRLTPFGQRLPPAKRSARYDAIAADASSR